MLASQRAHYLTHSSAALAACKGEISRYPCCSIPTLAYLCVKIARSIVGPPLEAPWCWSSCLERRDSTSRIDLGLPTDKRSSPPGNSTRSRTTNTGFSGGHRCDFVWSESDKGAVIHEIFIIIRSLRSESSTTRPYPSLPFDLVNVLTSSKAST